MPNSNAPDNNILHDEFIFRCGTRAKNRIVLAPMTNRQSPTSMLSDDEYEWLAMRIRGGYGIVTSCATYVMKSGQAWEGQLGIFDDMHIDGLSRLAKTARKENCLMIPQLFHGGVRCPSRLTGVQPVSASEFVFDTPDFEKPRPLSNEEIVEVENAFVAAAKRAIAAGLPGVEVHGANGYLFTQFLSPSTNRRADLWGGSIENRARILIDTVKKVRRAIGSGHILGVRISPEDTRLMKLDIDEMLNVTDMLVDAGIDYLSLSLGSALKSPEKYPDSAVSVLERYRERVPAEIAITVSGQIFTREEALAAIDRGADFVALGAAGIANPSWASQSVHEDFQPRRFPMTVEELRSAGLSAQFVEYLRLTRPTMVKG